MSMNHTTPRRAEQVLYVLLTQSDTHEFCGRVEEHCSKETLYLSAIEISFACWPGGSQHMEWFPRVCLTDPSPFPADDVGRSAFIS